MDCKSMGRKLRASRAQHGWSMKGEEFQISLRESSGEIVLKKVKPVCLRCQSEEGLKELKPGCYLCENCIRELR